MAARKKGPAQLSDAHKEALAIGRTEGRAVRNYLEALELHRPRRGRKRTSESIERRLAAIDEELAEADPLSRLHLVQERMDLERELAAMHDVVDIGALEDAFVDAAPGYSRRKGISYGAWRELGVSAAVLRRAGISRAGG